MKYRDYEDREMYERDSYGSRRGRDYGMDREYENERRYEESRMRPDERYMGAGVRGNWGNTPFMIERMGYPYDMRSRRGRGRDYGAYGDYNHGGMDEKALEHWKKKLMHQLDEHEKEMFRIEKVIKRAHDMRIDFDKFTEDEFYITVLMLYTDYKETLGKTNAELYIKLAKDFLCDEDAGVKYGEKLMAYYESIADA